MIGLISLTALAVAMGWEKLRARVTGDVDYKRRYVNVAMWLFNTTAGTLLAVSATPWRLSGVVSYVAGFLILDFLVYAAHYIQHTVPFLWAIHEPHHSDVRVDWSTALRHHPFEWFANGVFYLAVILALGIPGPAVIVHSTMVFVWGMFNHSNVRWPGYVERWSQTIMMTLNLHLVHHSSDPENLNVNFGGILCIWDRIFGTFKSVSQYEVELLNFGVDESEAHTRPLVRPLEIWRGK